jgi:lipopolysaccharide/colanic/teichoic acid biosynthesis glycosyltransferase
MSFSPNTILSRQAAGEPGLTGWAQVNYGYASNGGGFSHKMEYDFYYIKRRNLLLDFSIILRTSGLYRV